MLELKPCPFCGKAPRIRIAYAPDHGTDMLVIECFTSPKICVRPITRWCFTEEEAAEQWNRRANDGND